MLGNVKVVASEEFLWVVIVEASTRLSKVLEFELSPSNHLKLWRLLASGLARWIPAPLSEVPLRAVGVGGFRTRGCDLDRLVDVLHLLLAGAPKIKYASAHSFF